MENELSHKIIGAAIEVHSILGPGLLESIYEAALTQEIRSMGLKVERQVSIPVIYKGVIIKEPLFLDLLVENQIVVEVKSTDKIHSIYCNQLLSYLKLSNKKIGLIINFNTCALKDGIKRIVNGL